MGDEQVEKMARLLCRLDAFRNNGRIRNRAEMDYHVDNLWEVFKEDAAIVLNHAKVD
jgi:hypothetical protein